ncbi:hypothetical protein GCM10025734_05300 [Kitasatospora paranensis]
MLRGMALGRRVVLPLGLQTMLMVLLGLLLTGPVRRATGLPGSGLDEWLARSRVPALDTVSGWLSQLACTATVVSVTAVVVVALLAGSRGRLGREAAFLGGSVAAQSAVFLLVTACVERSRPAVPAMDAAPPTSSFPSGHTGAALALYGGLAVLFLLLVRSPARVPLAVTALLLPLLVGASRLYRGMHHPTDVLAGLLNGGLVLWIMWRALLADRAPSPTAAGTADGRSGASADRNAAPGVLASAAPLEPGTTDPSDRTDTEAAGPAIPASAAGTADTPGTAGAAGGDPAVVGGGAVVVFHPHLVGPATREALRAVLAEHGFHRPRFAATTVDDPGRGVAAQAVREGAALVVACGGDGTVTACAHALAGSATALAIVPCGTGNVLARNLRLPGDPVQALRTALAARPRRIDLAFAEGDGIVPTCVCAMAGIGLDAAIVAGTGRGLKRRLGWPAYLLPVLRHLRDQRVEIAVTLDDEPVLRRRVQMAVVGNVGSLQAGVRLLPEAEPDDGLLDLVLLHPHGIGGWTAALLGLGMGRPGRRTGDAHGPLEYFRARRITVTADSSAPRELDGEAVPAGRTLTLQVQPAALLIHAPDGVRRRPGSQRTPEQNRAQDRERAHEPTRDRRQEQRMNGAQTPPREQAHAATPPGARSVSGEQPAAPATGRGN